MSGEAGHLELAEDRGIVRIGNIYRIERIGLDKGNYISDVVAVGYALYIFACSVCLGFAEDVHAAVEGVEVVVLLAVCLIYSVNCCTESISAVAEPEAVGDGAVNISISCCCDVAVADIETQYLGLHLPCVVGVFKISVECVEHIKLVGCHIDVRIAAELGLAGLSCSGGCIE